MKFEIFSARYETTQEMMEAYPFLHRMVEIASEGQGERKWYRAFIEISTLEALMSLQEMFVNEFLDLPYELIISEGQITIFDGHL